MGHDGVLNAASALDGKVSLNKGIVQVAGSAGTIEVNRLRRLANEFEPFRSLLIRHEQVLFAQSQQSAACNASHSVEARMCRWLLYMRDLAGSDDLDADAGISRPDAGRAAAKRVDRREPAAKSGPDQIQSRPYAIAGRQGITKARLRVLRHGQGPLPTASFELAINSQKTPLCTEPYTRFAVRLIRALRMPGRCNRRRTAKRAVELQLARPSASE